MSPPPTNAPMPRLKQTDPPFWDLRRLLLGYELTGYSLGDILGASHVTARRRIDHPEELTLRELSLICRRAHIPADVLRDAIKF